MQKKTFLIFGIIIILLVVVLVIYAMRPTAPTESGGILLSPSVEPSPPPPQSSMPQGGEAAKEFSITARQWEFSPSSITVQQGDRVMFHITSVDVTHGFAIPDFNVNVSLVPNEMKTIEFIADKQGTFGFFCSIFCGSGHANMVGQLMVE